MAPFTFGFELEVSDGATSVIDYLRDRGALSVDGLHEYHCMCTDCNHFTRDEYFTAQEDCTANGEFISKVLTYGTDEGNGAIRALSTALVATGARTSGDVGLHVHVGKQTKQDDGRITDASLRRRRTAERKLLARLFVHFQDELDEIAAGNRGEVRGYNSKCGVTYDGDDLHGSWLDMSRHAHTYEFRLWNAVKAEWRIRLAVGLSVAMVAAARAGVQVEDDDTRCMEEVLAPFMDADTWSGLIRQRYYKGGVAA